MTPLPGAPFLHRRGTELWLEDVRLADLARRSRHAAVRLFAQRDARGAGAVPEGTVGPTASDLLCDEGQLQPCGLADLRGCGLRLRHRVGRRAAACAGHRRRPVARGVLGRRQDGRRDASCACRGRALLQRRERIGTARAVARWPRQRASARRSACASTRTSMPRRIPTSPPGCAATSSASRTSARWPCTSRRRDCPGIEVVGIDCHIGSQVTDSRTVSRSAGAAARSGGSGRARGRAAVAHRSRRRPGHHLHRRGAAGRRRADRRHAGAHRCPRPRASRDPDRARAFAGRQRRRPAGPRAGAQARRANATSASSTRR